MNKMDKKVLLLGWGKSYDEMNYTPRCAPIALEEYYKILSSAAITTLDQYEQVHPDIVCKLDNSEWWQHDLFKPHLGQYDIIIDSISWLAPFFDKKTFKYKPLFMESINKLLCPGGRFIGYDNEWFVENKLKPTLERAAKLYLAFNK